VKPAMADLRVLGDTIETHVEAALWPMPSYREMLFLK
jgi:glutamine synthetase type III